MHHPLEPVVEISTTIDSLYDLVVEITTVRTTASSAEPAVIRSFTDGLFLLSPTTFTNGGQNRR
jgi:hypothetical protein